MKILLALLFSFNLYAQNQARPWIGIYIEESERGVLIKDTVKGTPGEKAGLISGDIIYQLDETKVKTPRELIELVAKKGIGNKVIVKYFRNDKKESVSLKLVLKPGIKELVEKQLLNQSAPNIKGNIISGLRAREFNLYKLKKRPTLIMFWATWCYACGLSQPALAKFAQDYKDKINIVAVSSEQETFKIKKYVLKKIKSEDTNKHVIFVAANNEGNTIRKDYMMPALPSFVVIDQARKIRHIAIGSGETMLRAFKATIDLSQI